MMKQYIARLTGSGSLGGFCGGQALITPSLALDPI
jgi:hypothetical protein